MEHAIHAEETASRHSRYPSLPSSTSINTRNRELMKNSDGSLNSLLDRVSLRPEFDSNPNSQHRSIGSKEKERLSHFGRRVFEYVDMHDYNGLHYFLQCF